MPFKIKNWKLALLAFIFIGIFCGLGTWQLSRAKQKEVLLANFDERLKATHRTSAELALSSDWRFYRARLHGYFDNEHTFLLDNKTFHGQVGYEIYTPFKAEGLLFPILVDRGFIPLGKNRNSLPNIAPITAKTEITGLLNLPPAYFALGNMADSKSVNWPLRIQYVNLSELKNVYNTTLFPYILLLAPDQTPYAIEWKIVISGPEKHKGYALQWFALALTLLILFIVLNVRSQHKSSKGHFH